MGPCRPHPCSRRHRQVVADYRAARRAWETACDSYVAGAWDGGAAERAAFALDTPPPTFGAWLRALREDREDVAA